MGCSTDSSEQLCTDSKSVTVRGPSWPHGSQSHPFPQDSKAATKHSEGPLRAWHSGEGLIDLPVMAKRPQSNSAHPGPSLSLLLYHQGCLLCFCGTIAFWLSLVVPPKLFLSHCFLALKGRSIATDYQGVHPLSLLLRGLLAITGKLINPSPLCQARSGPSLCSVAASLSCGKGCNCNICH